MSSKAELPRRPDRTAALSWGLAATLSLVVGAGVLSTLEVSASQRRARALVRQAERTTYLVGRIGQQIARLRANVLEALTEDPREAATFSERIAALDAELSSSVRELEPRLTAEEQVRWRRLLPQLERLRQIDREAMALVLGQQPVRAEQVLDQQVRLAKDFYQALDVMVQLNQAESARLFAAADRRISAARLIEILASGALFIGCGVIWMVVIGTIRRQQVQIEEHMDRIETANRDLDAFAGRISHDLKNVLSPVVLVAARLKQAKDQPASVAELASKLDRSVRRAAGLLDGLLAFSRAGGPREGPASCPMAQEIRETVEELAGLAEEVGAAVELDLDDDLRVACAKELLHVVGLNLISNALKFLQGRARRSVRIRLSLDQGSCLLEVTDTGPGIPEAARARIFEPFYRVPGTEVPGTGIGLATVKRVIEAQGGRIALESVVGEGSVFRVWLPRAGP